jgi:hypothetical protein
MYRDNAKGWMRFAFPPYGPGYQPHLSGMPKGFSPSTLIQTAPDGHSEGAKRPKNLKKSEILRCAQNDKYELMQSAIIFGNRSLCREREIGGSYENL